MPDLRGLRLLAFGFVLAAPMAIGAASRWNTSLTLGPERFNVPSSQGGAAIDQLPWAGQLAIGYDLRANLTVRVGTGFLTGDRLEKVTPAQGAGSKVEDKLWGYPAEIGLIFPLKLRDGLRFMPGMSLGYYRLHYQEEQTLGGTAAATQSYRLTGFGGVLSGGLEARVSERLFILGEVRAGLPLLRESWTEGSDSTQASYTQDVRPSWSGMGIGFRWGF